MGSNKYRRKAKPRFTGNQIILMIIAAAMLAGIVAGALIAAVAGNDTVSRMKDTTETFLRGFDDGTSRSDIFLESMIKHGKVVVAVWLLAFTPVGGIVSVLIVFARGVGYGYATAFLVRCYGAVGLTCGAFLYLPQSLVMIPAYFFVTCGCIRFAPIARLESDKADSRVYLTYMLTLLIGCACVVVTAFVEAWLTPILINGIIVNIVPRFAVISR